MLNLLTGCLLTVYLLAVYILTGCLLRMLDLLTSSGNLRSARIGTALSLPAVLAYPCTRPHLGGAQHMCWIYLLAQVTAAVRGLVRRFRYLLC